MAQRRQESVNSSFTDTSPDKENFASGTPTPRKRSIAAIDRGSDHDDGPSESALGLGPRKRPCVLKRTFPTDRQLTDVKRRCRTDPLVHHGRHFGRTIQAFCRIQTLIKNGMLRSFQLEVTGELSENEERREHEIYKQLLKLSPGLEDRLCNGSDEDIFHVAELIQKGSSTARADDTKGLKGVIIDWITPPGEALRPPLTRNVKTDRGFYHDVTGRLLCPIGLDWKDAGTKEGLRNGTLTVSGDQWPLFLYEGYVYDPNDIWKGLFRSVLLISAFKHIFTSPSSVDRQPRATRSGNARIHGMTKVTVASLAYVATQVRFALSSSPVFSRTDLLTDSERFYGSVIDEFHNPAEEHHVTQLLKWWNQQIFPASHSRLADLKEGSVLALMRQQRERSSTPMDPIVATSDRHG
ncbi:hypothetical protein BKA70DRAFT_1088146 [Coprinopsis sp. MPI-PUGE-AT-0042]|nr:hypothetical protein BKA70DRAFT_1088146 [Coprinopsis sp. MPI-PUGE-AT-0042]